MNASTGWPHELDSWMRQHVAGTPQALRAEEPALADVWLDDLRSVATHEGAAVLVDGDADHNRVLGVIAVQEWESELFGRPGSAAHLHLICGSASIDSQRALVRRALAHAAKRHISLIAVRISGDAPQTAAVLEAEGFALVDSLVDYVARPASTPDAPIAEGYQIRLARRDDRAASIAIAERAFSHHFGRYHADPKIRRDEAARVYPRWLASAFDGYADAIFVAEHDGEVAGCTLWKLPTSTARRFGVSLGAYSLGMVADTHNGRGLFTALTVAGLRWSHEQGVRYVCGPTHVRNTPIHRAYARIGFASAGERLTFHRWLDR